jgi:hypothetical protein
MLSVVTLKVVMTSVFMLNVVAAELSIQREREREREQTCSAKALHEHN